jgi:hypothetical protein
MKLPFVIISRKQDEAQREKLESILQASTEKTKLLGRMLTALREARDYMLTHPPHSPTPIGKPKTEAELSYRETLIKAGALLERKQ